MKKLKIYLDTSVISHLFAEDTPDKMVDTQKLWNKIDNYDICISAVVTREIEDCSEPKQSQMIEKLRIVNFIPLEETKEVKNLVLEYIKNGVLKETHMDDCYHIAYAVLSNCDYIVSWNFKHLVNVNTINKVNIVNAMNHYKEISIIPPTMLVEEE